MAFELGSYFQNFRRYARSYDPTRMHDGAGSGGPVSACNPFSYLGDNDSLPINPCGQIANSFFNDTFSLLATPAGASAGAPLEMDDSGIAWSSDADHLYGPVTPENYNTVPDLRGGNTSVKLLNENQHWMVRPMRLLCCCCRSCPVLAVRGSRGRRRPCAALTRSFLVAGCRLVLPAVHMICYQLAGMCRLHFPAGPFRHSMHVAQAVRSPVHLSALLVAC